MTKDPYSLIGRVLDECEGLRQTCSRSHLPPALLRDLRDALSPEPEDGSGFKHLTMINQMAGRSIRAVFEQNLRRGDALLLFTDGAFIVLQVEADADGGYLTAFASHEHALESYLAPEQLCELGLMSAEAVKEANRRERIEIAERHAATAQQRAEAAAAVVAKLKAETTWGNLTMSTRTIIEINHDELSFLKDELNAGDDSVWGRLLDRLEPADPMLGSKYFMQGIRVLGQRQRENEVVPSADWSLLGVIQQIRAAAGDPHGRLMLDELIGRIAMFTEAAALRPGNRTMVPSKALLDLQADAALGRAVDKKWPGGLDEIEAAIENWRDLVHRIREAAGDPRGTMPNNVLVDYIAKLAKGPQELHAAASEAIRAHDQLQVAEAGGWQSIDTMPAAEDVSFLILIESDLNEAVAVEVQRFEGQLYPSALRGLIDWSDRVDVSKATHWRPVLALPAEVATGTVERPAYPPAEINKHDLQAMDPMPTGFSPDVVKEALPGVLLDPAPLNATEAAIRAYELQRDAARYRWLRGQRWDEADMFVVTGGKSRIHLGTVCPSDEHLDVLVDARMQASNPDGLARARVLEEKP